MKKLKLKLDGMKDMLTKEQMRKITGGSRPDDAACALSGKHACYCSFTFVMCVHDCENCYETGEPHVCGWGEPGQHCAE